MAIAHVGNGKALCVYCNAEIQEHADYQKVTGWVRRRGGGGTNALRMRTPEPVWACQWCVDKGAKKVNPTQGALM